MGQRQKAVVKTYSMAIETACELINYFVDSLGYKKISVQDSPSTREQVSSNIKTATELQEQTSNHQSFTCEKVSADSNCDILIPVEDNAETFPHTDSSEQTISFAASLLHDFQKRITDRETGRL